jgi:ribosomal protein S18 acetylase RimI-like enzyme
MDNDIKNIFHKLSDRYLYLFLDFLKDLIDNQEYNRFHPHAFDITTIQKIISSDSLDEYWIMCEDEQIVSYGILRGWDEGFTIPSIGIAVSPNYRKFGFGKKMMLFLHSRAKERGASKIRLTVYKDNIKAIRLYNQLGYILESQSDSTFVGYLEI